MKRLLSLFLAACLALSLSGCLADYDTPKHAELSEQYDFYADSQSALSSGMAITPEQADEVFIILVSCGMEAKVTNVTRKAGDDGHCQVSAGYTCMMSITPTAWLTAWNTTGRNFTRTPPRLP